MLRLQNHPFGPRRQKKNVTVLRLIAGTAGNAETSAGGVNNGEKTG
jgi:hypothetical protein